MNRNQRDLESGAYTNRAPEPGVINWIALAISAILAAGCSLFIAFDSPEDGIPSVHTAAASPAALVALPIAVPDGQWFVCQGYSTTISHHDGDSEGLDLV